MDNVIPINEMAKFWKEVYTKEKAEACGIHSHEGTPVISWGPSRWIYYVDVLNFRFAFFSLEMLDEYIDFFQRKTCPSTMHHNSSPFSDGPAASVGDGQSPFERLPKELLKKNKKPKVLKVLLEARNEFAKI